jgi:hypothetical protein
MTLCPTCRKPLRKEIENVYEINDTKYFDLRLECSSCNYSKPVTVKRKAPVPKAPDTVTEMTASLKLRQYMPERKEGQRPKPKVIGESIKKALNPFKNVRELAIYGGAIILGISIEIAGLYFEGYLRTLQIYPLVGFLISLLIFVFGPIIIVGSAVYYTTRDKLKALLLGSIAVPLTIILLANLRLETWGV